MSTETDAPDLSVPNEIIPETEAPAGSNGKAKRKRKPKSKRRPRPGSVLVEDGIASVLTQEGRTDLANARRLVAIMATTYGIAPVGKMACA